jgi:hypothetical protein
MGHLDHLQTEKPVMTFEEWKQELINETAKHTGRDASTIKIDDREAKVWYDDGFTPYCTFRETYGFI